MSFLPFSFPGVPEVRCAFQTRSSRLPDDPYSGGNISFDVGDDPNKVLKARKELQKALGFTEWMELRQVHGREVVFDPDGNGIEERGVTEADGQASDRPGHALVVKTADCQPVLITHKDGAHVLALHVGWRGNVADMPGKGVREFCVRYELAPADCLAVRGPSLSPQAAEFINFEAEFGETFRDYYHEAARTVDLWRLTRDQLLRAGIPERQIFGLDLCTYSNPGLFFSYRRRKISGRQASLIWIEEQGHSILR